MPDPPPTKVKGIEAVVADAQQLYEKLMHGDENGEDSLTIVESNRLHGILTLDVPRLVTAVMALENTAWNERDGRCWCSMSRELSGKAEHEPRCKIARAALAEVCR